MKINPIQQNQSSFKGGLYFKNAKEYTKLKPFRECHVIDAYFVNAEQIVDMYSTKGGDPFVVDDGYQTVIQTTTGIKVVKEALDMCMQAWSFAMNVPNRVYQVGTKINEIDFDYINSTS